LPQRGSEIGEWSRSAELARPDLCAFSYPRIDQLQLMGLLIGIHSIRTQLFWEPRGKPAVACHGGYAPIVAAESHDGMFPKADALTNAKVEIEGPDRFALQFLGCRAPTLSAHPEYKVLSRVPWDERVDYPKLC
jgi:hypothetical protein